MSANFAVVQATSNKPYHVINLCETKFCVTCEQDVQIEWVALRETRWEHRLCGECTGWE